ncbi:MAG TPA: DUF2934 domain-containing protein [Nitrospira sp.]|jgi:hypothetical protein|nr:DUF2934 domain-containing protein [Nitrospira sp.]
MAAASKSKQDSKAAAKRAEHAKENPMWVPEGTWQRVAERAYALYEQRGRRDGYALDDWLEAEHIVKAEL